MLGKGGTRGGCDCGAQRRKAKDRFPAMQNLLTASAFSKLSLKSRGFFMLPIDSDTPK